MIEERKLAEICEKYKMNCEELIKTNPNILIYGNEQDIVYVLNFLKEELNIDDNMPILQVEQIAFLDNGQPFEYISRLMYHPDIVEYPFH